MEIVADAGFRIDVALQEITLRALNPAPNRFHVFLVMELFHHRGAKFITHHRSLKRRLTFSIKFHATILICQI